MQVYGHVKHKHGDREHEKFPSRTNSVPNSKLCLQMTTFVMFILWVHELVVINGILKPHNALVDKYTEGFPLCFVLRGSAYLVPYGDICLLTRTTGSSPLKLWKKIRNAMDPLSDGTSK